LASSFILALLCFIVIIALFSQNKARKKLPRGNSATAGFVYVISNEGSFGKDVFKVGMTRRSDPMVRIHELCDASVPFPFTVHAIIKTGHAPALEKQLHDDLTKFRVNRLNERKEFFCLPREKLEEIVCKKAPHARFKRPKSSAEWSASQRWNNRRRAF
jgi:hypothetical protein